jgi:spore coat protein U-like protein
MIRRLLILAALTLPLPAAAVIAGSGPAIAAPAHASATPAAPSQGGPADFTYCTGENGTCTISGIADIAYGANGNFYYAYGVTGNIPCDNAVFGDPDVGTVKACYTHADIGPSRFSFCVSEGRLCAFSGHADVAFGADGKFHYQYGVAAAVSCGNPVFGDPDVGTVKACYIKPDIGPPGYSFCVTENQTCSLSGPSDVAFGADGKFHYKYGVTGSIACSDSVFGDPDYGVVKACYVRPA